MGRGGYTEIGCSGYLPDGAERDWAVGANTYRMGVREFLEQLVRAAQQSQALDMAYHGSNPQAQGGEQQIDTANG